MLQVIGKKGIYTNKPTYKNVRCCRILAESARKRFRDCIEDFDVFRRMSPHIKQALTSRGIDDFKVALKFVNGMKQLTGLQSYGINVLIIYSCLLDDIVFHD